MCDSCFRGDGAEFGMGVYEVHHGVIGGAVGMIYVNNEIVNYIFQFLDAICH